VLRDIDHGSFRLVVAINDFEEGIAEGDCLIAKFTMKKQSATS
jgi:hypothetical protein